MKQSGGTDKESPQARQFVHQSKKLSQEHTSHLPANEGTGVSIHYLDGQTESLAVPTGKHCSNYGVDMQALRTAASAIQRAGSDYRWLVFLTHALSLLEDLSNNKEPQLMDAL